MSAAQNLSYSVIQVVHNFGAVATVSGSLLAARLHDNVIRRKLAYWVLGGWLVQAASGASFGVVSYYYYHQFPDISGIAVDALGIKMVCATLGIVLLLFYLARNVHWPVRHASMVWIASSTLAITAISAAAFLRWFA